MSPIRPVDPIRSLRQRLSLCVLLLLAPLLTYSQTGDQVDRGDVVMDRVTLPPELKLRARVTAIDQPEHMPTKIVWKQGGEGVTSGGAQTGVLGEGMVLGQWTEPVSVAELLGKAAAESRIYLGIITGHSGKMVDRITRKVEGYSTGVGMEFEFLAGDKVLKTITSKGPDGGTFTLVIPTYLLANKAPLDNPKFVAGLNDVLGYAKARAEFLEGLPWANGPLPKRFAILTDLLGYGSYGYGVRHSDLGVLEAEARSLRQLGVNGLRDANTFLTDQAARGEGFAKIFNRAMITYAGGFPVVPYRAGRASVDGAGCPSAPQVEQLTAESIERAGRELLALPLGEVWALTVDEIGSVFDGAPEKKEHMAQCERCMAAYRVFLQEEGRAPQDFGQENWADVKPPRIWSKDPNEPKPWLSDPHAALNAYYARRFNNQATARLFRPLREFFKQANAKKKAALEAGKTESPEARQPWVFTFALRGNTFLMRGHSLDFFDFYRDADNAFVYETSNRDARVWGWDSYLCDVGRMVRKTQGHELGIYIKPARGAVIQRSLSSISRGFRMLYWYTYGPDYAKGDSFSHKPEVLEDTSRAAHLIAKSEDVLFGAQWMQPAKIAIVKPFSLMGKLQGELGDRKTPADPLLSASWEDTKWTYSALTHQHLAVDPLDEKLLTEGDLSGYKVIYVPSPILTRTAAEKLAAWVKAGGTLFTNASGLSQDESGRPLNPLAEALGLADRKKAEVWSQTPLYLSGALEPFTPVKGTSPPKDAGVKFSDQNLPLIVGREILNPKPDAKVLARFSDGGAALTEFAYGQGHVFVAGFFPGLEYSASLRSHDFDMEKGLQAQARDLIALPSREAGVEPTVAPSSPLVEGILLQNPETQTRAVTLMNWGYRTSRNRVRTDAKGNRQVVGSVAGLIPQKDLQVAIRGAGPVSEAHSVALEKSLPLRTEGETTIVTVPELQEGDVLLLK